jgi:hypothetical protein
MPKLVSKLDKRETPAYAISITFPDGKKLVKTNLTLSGLFDNYFINLDSNLDSGKFLDAESIYNKYQELFNKCKVNIQFTDSWGHRWKGKTAWPRKEKFINYLTEKLNDRKRVS